MPNVILRLVAVLVLVTGVADYSAFDVANPLAPMGSAEATGTQSRLSHRLQKPMVTQETDAQDDGCICCAAGLTMSRIHVSDFEIVASTHASYFSSLRTPFRDPVERPPRT